MVACSSAEDLQLTMVMAPAWGRSTSCCLLRGGAVEDVLQRRAQVRRIIHCIALSRGSEREH